MDIFEYDTIKRKRWQRDIRESVKGRTNGRCAYCGRELTGRFALDHVVPLRKGGADDQTNLFAACTQCNHYKATMDIEQFRRAISNTPKVLIGKSLTGRIAAAYGMLEPKGIKFYYESCADVYSSPGRLMRIG